MSYNPQQLFPSWYAKTDLNLKKETIELRIRSLEKVMIIDDRDFWMELTKFYLGYNCNQQKIEEFINHFSSVDVTFPLIDNDFLVRTLVSIALIFRIHLGSERICEIISLALVNCTFFFKTLPNQDIPVLHTAEQYLIKISQEKRICTTLTAYSSFADLKTKYDELENDEALDLEETKEIIKAIDLTIRSNAILSEEVNVLWWITGEHSNSFESSFKDLGIQNMVLTSAFDLLNLTQIPARFKSAKYLLHKSLLMTVQGKKQHLKEQTLYDAIKAIKREYVARAIDNLGMSISGLTPTLLSMQKSMEFDAAEDWSSSFKHINPLIDHKGKYSPEELAFQIYSELIFIRTLK